MNRTIKRGGAGAKLIKEKRVPVEQSKPCQAKRKIKNSKINK